MVSVPFPKLCLLLFPLASSAVAVTAAILAGQVTRIASPLRPVALPTAHMHAIYTNLPATTRRAANVPFLVGRSTPFPHTPTPAPATAPGPRVQQGPATATHTPIPRIQTGPPAVRPSAPTRRPTAPPRRNAISYHPSSPSSVNPFADSAFRPPRAPSPPKSTSPPPAPAPTSIAAAPVPAPVRTKPAPQPSRLVSAGHISGALLNVPMRYNPPPLQMDTPARLVASVLLSRGGRSRPMRGPAVRRVSNTYVRSGLSVCISAEA